MDVLGVNIYVWHALVVEEHTGIIIFVIAALVVRMFADLTHPRFKRVSEQLTNIHIASDVIAYSGSFLAVLFLILSGITGYLILPYSVLVSQSIYLNKSLLALGALFFWSSFVFMRYWYGPGLWERKGLYAVEVGTALLGLMFTALAASIGAELTIGASAMQYVYNALNFNWRAFSIQPVDVVITGALLIVGVVLVFVLTTRNQKKTTG